MPVPTWNDPSLRAGTMVRGALWLMQVIGEGNSFTKAQIRRAFPGVAQADRRIRDLRDFGWVLLSNTEDALLLAEEQRFVSPGVPVWDAEVRRAASRQKALSPREKRAVMARDGFLCTECGIGASEPYPDDPLQSAVLSVYRHIVHMPDGGEAVAYATECRRCHSGDGPRDVTFSEVRAQLSVLAPHERDQLASWLDQGRRRPTRLDLLWHSISRLPADVLAELRTTLKTD